MKIKLNYYGKLVEITKTSSEMMDVEELQVFKLKKMLGESHAALLNMTYQLAEKNTILKDEDFIQTDELDVFPPFSGG